MTETPAHPLAAFTVERTARKRRRCSVCTKRIEPGERYLAHALPPDSELGNEGWWHTAAHLRPADCSWD
jgi:hypothetical protein